jgi:hypothetical protein
MRPLIKLPQFVLKYGSNYQGSILPRRFSRLLIHPDISAFLDTPP